MPAHCNPSAYDVYAQWCADHGRTPPTREWWDGTSDQARISTIWNDARRAPLSPAESQLQAQRADRRLLSDIEFDLENERREGWCHQPENYHSVGG